MGGGGGMEKWSVALGEAKGDRPFFHMPLTQTGQTLF